MPANANTVNDTAILALRSPNKNLNKPLLKAKHRDIKATDMVKEPTHEWRVLIISVFF